MKKGSYHFTECGLDNVYLVNGYTKTTTPHGDGVAFENLEGLLEVIARAVVSSPQPLRGQEVRFLRTRLDMSQSGLGKLLGKGRSSIARWEAEPNKPIEGAADTGLRFLFAAVREEKSLIKTAYEAIQDRDFGDHEPQPIPLSKEADRWATAC